MIHVIPQPEPAEFDVQVRQPGRIALDEHLNPLPPHWRKALPALRQAYKNVCAYLAVYIPPGTGSPTVDHFVPTSVCRDLAYEWSNYRLASKLMNERKWAHQDVLDPFEVEDGWFTLELLFLQVKPNPALPPALKTCVEQTISRLRLNDLEARNARREWYDLYLGQQATFEELERRCPFVARELVRQKVVAPPAMGAAPAEPARDPGSAVLANLPAELFQVKAPADDVP